MSNDILAEHFGDLAAIVHDRVRWFGAAIESIPPAYAVLQSAPPMTDAQSAEALEFYAGNEQWPADVKESRQRANRPILVINRLPELFAASVAAHERDDKEPLTNADLSRLAAVIASQNRDAQMLYNYLLSQLAEMLILRSTPGSQRSDE